MPSLTWVRHNRDQTVASSLMCAKSGPCPRITTPVSNTRRTASRTSGGFNSRQWLKWAINATCLPAAARSRSSPSKSSASASLVKRNGQ